MVIREGMSVGSDGWPGFSPKHKSRQCLEDRQLQARAPAEAAGVQARHTTSKQRLRPSC